MRNVGCGAECGFAAGGVDGTRVTIVGDVRIGSDIGRTGSKRDATTGRACPGAILPRQSTFRGS
jgi:hypothetical protein